MWKKCFAIFLYLDTCKKKNDSWERQNLFDIFERVFQVLLIPSPVPGLWEAPQVNCLQKQAASTTVSSQLLINIVNSGQRGGSGMAFVFALMYYRGLCLNGGTSTSCTDSQFHQFGCEVIEDQSINPVTWCACFADERCTSGVHLPFQSQYRLKSELWSQLIKWRTNTPTWPHREERAGLKASLLNQKWL